jgi:hypothetical protein
MIIRNVTAIRRIDRPNGMAPLWGTFQNGVITSAFTSRESAKAFLAGFPDHSTCDHLDGICLTKVS